LAKRSANPGQGERNIRIMGPKVNDFGSRYCANLWI